jgi:hypothetical protein
MNEATACETNEVEGQHRSTLQAWFVISAGVILAITGPAKVWTACGNVKLLTVDDPILGLPFRDLMLVAGCAELVIAWVCLLGHRPLVATGLVALLSTDLLVYRWGLWWLGWHKPCNCLGNLTDTLHLSPQVADNIMKLVLAYLLFGSYGLLMWRWSKFHSSHFKQE